MEAERFWWRGLTPSTRKESKPKSRKNNERRARMARILQNQTEERERHEQEKNGGKLCRRDAEITEKRRDARKAEKAISGGRASCPLATTGYCLSTLRVEQRRPTANGWRCLQTRLPHNDPIIFLRR